MNLVWHFIAVMALSPLSIGSAGAQVPEYAPDYQTSTPSLYLEMSGDWVNAEADDQGDRISFRRFAVEPANFRNVFVLICEKSGRIGLEVVPPSQLLPGLSALTGGAEIKEYIYRVYPTYTNRHEGSIDGIAAWMDIDKSHLQSVLQDMSKPDYRIYFGHRLGYGLKETWAATKAVRAMLNGSHWLQTRGKTLLMSWQDVTVSCLRYMSET